VLLAPALLRVLDRLSDTPALILSSLGETLVQNRMAGALFGDNSGFTGLARSGIYRWFTDPPERLLYPERDRDPQSRAQVANLRAAYGAMGPRSRAGELVRALQKVSPEFAGLWARHEVARRFEDHKALVHPQLGDIEHRSAANRGMREAAAARRAGARAVRTPVSYSTRIQPSRSSWLTVSTRTGWSVAMCPRIAPMTWSSLSPRATNPHSHRISLAIAPPQLAFEVSLCPQCWRDLGVHASRADPDLRAARH
jgi:hypothetical protein